MEKEIKLIQKNLTPFGQGITKTQIFVTCSIGLIGRRYESKGNFIPTNSSATKFKHVLVEELNYMKMFLLALGFQKEHIINKINEFLQEEERIDNG